jgi:methylglutamate dehydrogenase subunit D
MLKGAACVFNLSPSPAFHLKKGHFGRSDTTGLTVKNISGLSIVALIAHKGQTEALRREMRDRFGLELPAHPHHISDGQTDFIWAGPEQWLVMGADTDLYTKLASPFAATIDQSGGRSLLRLSGPKLRDILRKGVTLDLHPDVFKPHDVALTSIAHISAALWLLDAQSCEIAVARSFAGSFWHWLSVSAAEYGYEVG